MADVPLMNNPMTTQGDIVTGGASGAPGRLAIGTATQVLTVNAGATAPEWAAAPGGGGNPDCKESAMTTNVTMGTANTWTDSGMSLSLAAGTWLVEALLTIRVTQTGVEFLAVRLIESGGGSTIYAATGMNMPSNNGQEIPLVVRRRITLGSTTTVKVQGITELRTGVLVADSQDSTVPVDVQSYMTALAVTSA